MIVIMTSPQEESKSAAGDGISELKACFWVHSFMACPEPVLEGRVVLYPDW